MLIAFKKIFFYLSKLKECQHYFIENSKLFNFLIFSKTNFFQIKQKRNLKKYFFAYLIALIKTFTTKDKTKHSYKQSI